MHDFTGSSDGADPYAALIQASDGNFYGTARHDSWGGNIYRMTPQGEVTGLYNFSGGSDGPDPYAPLVQASDGNLYGATGFFGTCSSIFRLELSGTFTQLHRFAYSADPHGGLIQANDGNLYGTASAGGTGAYGGIGSVFKVDLAGNYTPVYNFASTEPVAPQERTVEAGGGMLYGTTRGGSFGSGVIYRMDPYGSLSVLHSFAGPDGASPVAALCPAADGNLYGTTALGGSSGLGTAFKMLPNGGLTTLYSFTGGVDSAHPDAELIQGSDGNLYGTTSGGGGENGYGLGTVFQLSASGGLTVLHDFQGADGENPGAGLLQASDGNYYGTTSFTIFKVSSAGDFTKLADLSEEYGAGPKSSLIQLADGNFYGISANGGGVVYKMDASATVSTLHIFDGYNGEGPLGALVQGADGYLYSTTNSGGGPCGGWAASCGTIFRVDTTGDFQVVHRFNNTDGALSLTGLSRATDGRLYGTTSVGGPFGGQPAVGPYTGQGVIFRLSSAQIAVNEVSPSSGPGNAGDALAVLGGGFLTGATAKVGGVAATNVTIADPTFLYLEMPELSPGTLNDVEVTFPDWSRADVTATHPSAFFADFVDVPQLDPFHDYVEKIFRNGITAGCAAGSYCPQGAVTRAQMAVFLLKSKHGPAFVPPACAGVFGDVPCPSMFADWIEHLSAEGVTAGCGGGNYCPDALVTRAQMSVFLLKAKHGSSYAPPSCSGAFGDVACPSLFADWIEQLAAEQITGGCGGGNYCPGNPNTRAQMAAFLVKTFGL